MKYKNASDILPDKLLREIQKYSSGELIYIPKNEDRKSWGSGSGAQKYYAERNAEIREKYKREKISIEELSKMYSLSFETVRKIIYK